MISPCPSTLHQLTVQLSGISVSFSQLAHSRNELHQGFPTFFAARTPLSGQSILSTPKKILRYILLYKRYISCSVTQGSSYPLMFNLVPLGGTSTPGWEPLNYTIQVLSIDDIMIITMMTILILL